MAVQNLLSRLSGVREKGNDSWMACCPAHDDRTPSLGVTQKPDGTILIWCHAFCSANEIMDALGLPMRALFSEARSFKPRQAYIDPRHAAAIVDESSWLIDVIDHRIDEGEDPLKYGADRAQATQRIEMVGRMVGAR